jgi:hypothetical protein
VLLIEVVTGKSFLSLNFKQVNRGDTDGDTIQRLPYFQSYDSGVIRFDPFKLLAISDLKKE